MTELPDWWPYDKPYAIEDCLIGMKKLPDKCVDLVLTDPPYGVDYDYGGVYDDTRDNLKKLIPPLMEQLLRISHRCLITCGYENIYYYPKPDHILIWHVPSATSSSKWGFNLWQPILAYGKDPYLQNGLGRRADVITYTGSDRIEEYSCAKPHEFWIKLLERGSVKETDIVVDPFLGSGTTLLACRKTNRIGLGFEINPDYEGIIRKRGMDEVEIDGVWHEHQNLEEWL